MLSQRYFLRCLVRSLDRGELGSLLQGCNFARFVSCVPNNNFFLFNGSLSAGRLFETSTGEYRPFGPMPFLEHLYQSRVEQPRRVLEPWEAIDVFNPYRFFRAPVDEWEQEANKAFFVEDARSSFEFFAIVNSVPFPSLDLARATFASLSDAQRKPFEMLALQDADRHAREVTVRNRYFVPGTDWPRRFNDGVKVHIRCSSCFVLDGHMPECQINGFEICEDKIWNRLLMTEENFSSMLLLDIFREKLEKGPSKICEVRNRLPLKCFFVNFL